MSTSGDKRARAVCVRAFKLSQQRFTHREIAALIFCAPAQVSGKVEAGRLAMIRDERSPVSAGAKDV